MVTVREMTSADTERVSRVHEAAARAAAEAAYDDAGRWTRDRGAADYQEDLDDEEAALYVAEVEGTIVGFGAADLAEGDVVADYVDPAYQDEGVGTALLNRVERALLEAGHDEASLTASINAEAFYQRHGYEVTDRTDLEEAEVEFPVVKMRRELRLD
jgi:ribosomal-protein-alanine N-acetyltransferase